MDLNALFSIISQKGYHHFDGRTNSTNDNLYLDFSTGYNGRGNFITLRLNSDDNDIDYRTDNIERTSLKNISDSELFTILKDL